MFNIIRKIKILLLGERIKLSFTSNKKRNRKILYGNHQYLYTDKLYLTKYSFISDVDENTFIVTNDKKQYALIDRNNNVIVPYNTYSIFFNRDIIVVEHMDVYLCGVIDNKGKLIVPINYNLVYKTKNNYIVGTNVVSNNYDIFKNNIIRKDVIYYRNYKHFLLFAHDEICNLYEDVENNKTFKIKLIYEIS